MFGLEDQKRKKAEDFVFELERELRNAKKMQALKKRIDMRIQRIKEVLRSGENKEEFDQFGLLLHGYTSLLKVMGRFSGK